MSPEAKAIKQNTLERYRYCVEDRVTGFDERLREAEKKPDIYWEEQAQRT